MTQPNWPEGVAPVSLDDITKLGVDSKKRLYWDGVPIVTSPLSALTFWQKIIGLVLGFAAVLGGIGSFAQGWTAYNDWACKMKWKVAVCSSP